MNEASPTANLTKQDMLKLETAFQQMKEKCKTDPVFFFDNFLRIYNPKKNPTDIPFKTYPYQKRLIRQIVKAIEYGEDIFIDKTREMGISYVVLGVFLWFWLSRPGFTALVGSRTEKQVDNRKGGTIGSDDASLFAKMGYMIERLPAFMLPVGWNPRLNFPYLKLINPENGSAISGESSTANFSRSGRYQVILLDEFAFFEEAYGAWGATRDASKCRIVVTTPGIKPGKAKRLRHGDDGEKIKVIKVPYHLHPEKNAKWLAKEKEERSEEDFNREIMMDWGLSVRGRIYPELDLAVSGKFPFIVNQPLYVSGDYGLDGTIFEWWQQNPLNGKWRMIDSFMHEDEPIEYYFPLFGKPPDSMFDYGTEQLRAFEEISKLPKGIHVGDPSVHKRSGNAEKKSDFDKLAEIGIYVYTYTKENSIDYRVKETKMFLKQGIEVNENERNYTTLDLMKQYRWKTWDEDHETTSPFRRPLHNNSSHPATAMEYMAVNLKTIQVEAPIQPKPESGRFLTSRSSIKSANLGRRR